MSYSEWAVRLVKHFFGPQFANQRVRLMVTREVLDQNFPDLGGAKNFLHDMRAGPDWRVAATGRSMCQHGLDLFNDWKYPARFRPKKYPKELATLENAPPFLPYLCLLCLAWTEGEESFAANAYYARLDPLCPNHDLRGNLPQWDKLWDGLEKWADGLKGAWGKFVVERLGGWNYVGIPRSQVIFTPTKIERFPELFVRCGIEPGASMSADQLRHTLATCEAISRPVLGSMVFEQIEADTPIGKSAVEAVLEHFDNWDGSADFGAQGGGGFAGAPGAPAGDQALLALQPTNDNTRWQTKLVLERDAICERVVFPAKDWRVRLNAETLATIINTTGEDVDANSLSSAWTTGANLNGKILSDDEDVEVVYKLPGRKVRLFDRWIGNLLVETRSLPSAGPAYALVHAGAAAEWQTWQSAASKYTNISDATWEGLPNGQHLFCVTDTALLPSELRLAFPGGTGAAHGRPRYLRLFSGTRCNSSTARRVYAEYDPPTLIVQAPRGALPTVTGATMTSLADDTAPENLPGYSVRSYSLVVDVGHSVVTIAIDDNGTRLAGLSFGVHRDRVLHDGGAPTEFFDRFGENSTGSGINGVMVPEPLGESWHFENGPFLLGDPATAAHWNHPSFKFLESLHHHGGRVTYQEYKRRAMRIAGAEGWRISEETQWLSQLGFIELHTDSNGRWSHVCANKLQLYPLPWLAEGRFQVVVAGCGQLSQLKELAQIATVLDCDLRVATQACKLLPPRLTILHPEKAAGQQIAHELGLEWSAQPPAYQIGQWAGSLNEWLEKITWYPDPGPRASAEYSPEQFRFLPNEPFPAPWRLRQFVDQFTQQRWHCLYRPQNAVHPEQHAYVRDRSWAMWRVHMLIAPDDDVTNIAYDTGTHRLIVPCELRFPYLFGRAMATCSGLAPRSIHNCWAYCDREAGVLAEDAAPYSGKCYGYELVPTSIADTIASKLSARLIALTLTK